MEKLVAELNKIVTFKDTTNSGDIVLVAALDPQMLFYALVGDIIRDESRKAEWWHITLHFLIIPPQTAVWTLRTPQFTGQETFTMGGKARFIKAISFDKTLESSMPSGEYQKSKHDGKSSFLHLVK